MSYDPFWSQDDGAGALLPAAHAVRLADAAEIVAAVNRRRRLTYQPPVDYSGHVAGAAPVRRPTYTPAPHQPAGTIRTDLAGAIAEPPSGSLGGTPPSPEAMDWLWPLADADEDKRIVTGPDAPGPGEVHLLERINGTRNWTDPDLPCPQTPIRAVHLHEYRRAVERLRRGRWTLPVYFSAGIFSAVPDVPWLGEAIVNDGSSELRSVGFVRLRTADDPPRGLTGAAVREATRIELTADADASVALYRCLRPVAFTDDAPTWNHYRPAGSLAWDAPGGTGPGDAELLATLNLTAEQPGSAAGPAVTAAIQAMVDGAEQNLLLRRSDLGGGTVGVAGRVVVEFDLDCPPN